MHFIDVKQLNKYWVQRIISKTYEMINYREKPLKDKILISYFCEPSTRTCASFQTAMIKLGGSVISLQGENTSNQKGESLEDSIKTLNYYGDVIVLRHPEKGSSERASKVSTIPIINAGDGNGEHPTQALLDIFTIFDELKKRNINLYDDNRNEINITFTGDLKNSRTIHSLVKMLTYFKKINITYLPHNNLNIPKDIYEIIDSSGLKQEEINIPQEEQIKYIKYLMKTDILYMTRIQKERFFDNNNIDDLNQPFQITTSNIHFLKETAIIMHPLPRLQEITPLVDNNDKCVYFKQVENGVYVRMAILYEIILS
jgi:carbamoyl-phosphate synthase/aspartate carbamoyltransferase